MGKIKDLIHNGNLTEISEQTGISYRTLQNWRHGSNNWLADTENKLTALQKIINEKEGNKMKKYYLNDALGNHYFDVNDLPNSWEQDDNGWFTYNKSEFDWFIELAEAYDIVNRYDLNIDHIDDYENVVAYAQEEKARRNG